MMTFDPAEATRAYIDSLGPEALAKAEAYTRGNHWLELWGLAVAALVTWIIVRTGVLDKVHAKLERRGWALRTFLVVAAFTLVSTVIALPWAVYTDWYREAQYGLTSQPLADFLGQGALILVITTLLGSLFFLGLYWLIRKTGKAWWMWASGLLAGTVLAVYLLVPAFIMPLFNQFNPIPEGEVRDAVVALGAEAGIPEDRIFMFDGSRQSNNFTANVAGIGGSARIAISDVALDQASLDEVKAVTGHEIGHYVLGHTYRNVVIITLLGTFMFFIISRAYPVVARRFGSDAPIGDVRSVAVVSFLISALSVLGSPITNTSTRIGENEADRFSLEMVGLPDAMAGALLKTAEYRYPLPNTIEEALFYTHPSVERRILRAMEWKAANMADDGEVPAAE